MGMFAMAIHGGAGALSPELYSPDEIQEYKKALKQALLCGVAVLEKEGSALEAVSAAVVFMEDCPLFNAGKGSVFSQKESIEMDASVMCGKTLKSGGVSCVRTIKNPILAANLVMQSTPHTAIGFNGAEELALQNKLAIVNQDYFKTPKRYEQFLKARERKEIQLDHGNDATSTVGAVAVDMRKNLAAATSTGGLTYKHTGRISDSSLAGAGSYANNQTLAISGTGTGDLFITHSLCHDVHARILYAKKDLMTACLESLDLLKEQGGHGGFVAITKEGEIAMPFNSGGMFRASFNLKGEMNIEIF